MSWSSSFSASVALPQSSEWPPDEVWIDRVTVILFEWSSKFKRGTYVEWWRIVMITCRDSKLKLRIIVSIFVLLRSPVSKLYGFRNRKFSCTNENKNNEWNAQIMSCQCRGSVTKWTSERAYIQVEAITWSIAVNCWAMNLDSKSSMEVILLEPLFFYIGKGTANKSVIRAWDNWICHCLHWPSKSGSAGNGILRVSCQSSGDNAFSLLRRCCAWKSVDQLK